MTKNVTLRRPKLSDLDQLVLWENNLDNSLFSENPIFYTTEQIEEFLNSDQDIFLDRQIRFMIDGIKHTYTALMPDYFKKLLKVKRLNFLNLK